MSRKLGNKLKSIRLKRNLSQTEMANILGYSGKGMISRLENDSAEMSYEKLMILLSHFGDEFEGEELIEKSNVHFLHIAHSDKPVPFYSLDVVISAGYRVKSHNGIIFKLYYFFRLFPFKR